MQSPRVPSWVVRFENAWPGANAEGKLELRGPVSSEHGWGWGEEGTAVCIFDDVTYIVFGRGPWPSAESGSAWEILPWDQSIRRSLVCGVRAVV